jgi:hypothetical protein
VWSALALSGCAGARAAAPPDAKAPAPVVPDGDDPGSAAAAAVAAWRLHDWPELARLLPLDEPVFGRELALRAREGLTGVMNAGEDQAEVSGLRGAVKLVALCTQERKTLTSAELGLLGPERVPFEERVTLIFEGPNGFLAASVSDVFQMPGRGWTLSSFSPSLFRVPGSPLAAPGGVPNCRASVEAEQRRFRQAPRQTWAEGVRALCRAAEKLGTPPADPGFRAALKSRVAATVQNPWALELFAEFERLDAAKDPKAPDVLREATRASRLERCALAGVLQKP